MKNVTAYCLDWHLKSSDAFRDLLVAPLKNYMNIVLTAWDGDQILKNPKKGDTLLFCMLPPPQELLDREDLKLVWIPMWDQAQGYNEEWWGALPKHLRIIAFSEAIHKQAIQARLDVIRLAYYKDPASLKPATWDHGRIIYYWNRVGMVGPEFIDKLCRSLHAEELLFKPNTDPRIEENKFYELPTVIGKTKITVIQETSERADFLRQIERANIVLSPRLTEGVGMVFLESLARGCAVIAHDAPTMNEYINHGSNGVLLKDDYVPFKDRLSGAINKSVAQPNVPFLLTEKQPWAKIGRMNYKRLGDNAAQKSAEGYNNWLESTKKLIDFLSIL